MGEVPDFVNNKLNVFIAADSTIYYYSNGRGGVFNEQQYFGIINSPWYTFSKMSEGYKTAPVTTIDATLPTIDFDSAVRGYDPVYVSYFCSARYRNNDNLKYSEQLFYNDSTMLISRRQFPTSSDIDTMVRFYQGGRLYKVVHSTSNKVHGQIANSLQYYYNSNNLLDSSIAERRNITHNKLEYKSVEQFVYNNNNLLTKKIYIRDNGISIQKDTFYYHYNTSNMLVEAGGNSSPNIVNDIDRSVFLYSSGLIATMTAFFFDTNNKPDTISHRSYIYNNNGFLIGEDRWNTLDSKSGLTHAFDIDIQRDQAGNRIADVIYFDDYRRNLGISVGLKPWVKKSYTYNQHGNIILYKLRHWDSVTNNWTNGADSLFGYSQNVKLEYESYWPANVTDNKISTTNVQLYPMPAQDVLTIRARFDKMVDFSATILDLYGRALRKWNVAETKDYKASIPIPELPNGTYIIQMLGEGVKSRKQFTVIK